MHNTQKVFGQISRTLLKQSLRFELNKQPQQKLLTLTCHLANTPATQDDAHTNKTPSSCAVIPAQNYSKFTAAREGLPLAGTQLICEERAFDLISNLKETELAAIKLALKKHEAKQQKLGFEGKLAATQWRTRFGRLSKVPALGEVDPTGSFCAFPDDWLKKKAAEKAANPSSSDLWKIFFVNAVPFVGFGFLDNFTMIIAGDYIEHIFGTFMCISTMAAAGLGNTISDVLGIGSAYYVERGCEYLGLKPPDLTPIQMEMKSSRRAANYGRIIGITVGCLVGMFPLLFMDRKAIEDERKEEERLKKEEEEKLKNTEANLVTAQ
ncbi:uncharacterized protein LOC119600955 [Lucilia sericata]|uniref:uncharacterized protein LOC119600955 n=1 Tax=Lucilia sericata TaxID=13632 RepID=UPI0018A7EB45|nr:uncharacterized protein LOC119600955 [Lucilia sericata]